jgi:hypothetical protein
MSQSPQDRTIPGEKRPARAIGLYRGQFTVEPEFFEPLPEELIEFFEGARGADCTPPPSTE